MLKRVLPICILLVLMLQSCSLSGLPYELKGALDFVYGERDDEQSDIAYSNLDYVVYMDTIYYPDTKSVFAPDEADLKVLLGWDGLFGGIGYINKYYSYQKDVPVYIYDARSYMVFLRNDYDFYLDLFTIEGTELKISMRNVLIGEKKTITCTDSKLSLSVELLCRSETIPALKIPLEVFRLENNWYAMTKDSFFGFGTISAVYSVSDEFVEILRENNLIPLETD